MLHLSASTDAAWLARALANMEAILVDHAHCEKKAASTAVSMLFRYTEHAVLLAPLSALAREELAHFELVLEHLERRGIPFTRQEPSPYASRLLEIARHGEPQRLLDTLIVMAFIEARSAERMKLLAENLADAELAALYRGLLASEARHHATYLDLARALFPKDEVSRRVDEIAVHEARVIASAPEEPRIHN